MFVYVRGFLCVEYVCGVYVCVCARACGCVWLCVYVVVFVLCVCCVSTCVRFCVWFLYVRVVFLYFAFVHACGYVCCVGV